VAIIVLDKNRAFYNKQLKEIRNIMNRTYIVVIRFSDGVFKISKPCMHCMEYMKTIGLKKVYYSIDTSEIVCEKIKDLETTHVSLYNRTLI